ncbi:hypothetical protein FRZ06_03040 [Anoxybacterium hadale]|uniref:Uncharacterized protein n=1 Tax=Anoxybacterium hadale TaxID=3408580 RepID=A0ACD1A7N2_9FIRM|nr:hypothetical protein FRZ06_03040 [Clostridiales bacterium]
MKKKLGIAGITLFIIIVSILYFSTTAPIAKDMAEVQIQRVSVLNSKYEDQDFTDHIDCEILAQILSNYKRSRLPYDFAPYQAAVGDIDIGYFDHGDLKHISLGSVNVVYDSADRGGYKIHNSSELVSQIQEMIKKRRA